MGINRRHFIQGSVVALTAARLWAKAGELGCDVLVVGGGVGGFAAALAACRNGMRVVLTEETDWIGGQLTAQAVPPDEHPWIEQFGCTRSYRDYRDAVREYYRNHYPLTEQARHTPNLNPGNGGVSRLTHEFRVSVAVLENLLAPYLGNGQLTLLLKHVPVAAEVEGDRVRAVTMRDLERGTERVITAAYFLDATELGDLLPMTHTEFVTGAEAQSETGELHASAKAEPANSQSFTYCFAMDYLEGEDHTIERPADYTFWRDYVPKLTPAWTGPLLDWTAREPKSLGKRIANFQPNPAAGQHAPGFDIWLYRRIADRNNFVAGTYKSDVTLANWPQNDDWLGDLITAKSPQEKERLLQQAKQLSLSLLYWMQTDAPRADGGHGWKGLRLRKDIVDTDDGLAKTVYVRESRRIRAEFTVLEQHVGTEMRAATLKVPLEEVSAEKFSDSVGVGSYRIDLHPSAGGTNYIDISSLPFEIPLGALIPKRMENLLPACKNIGTTHITNGCYRLHPVEWNIGEAAGALAAYSVAKKMTPRAVRNQKEEIEEFRRGLVRQGFELSWPHIHPL
jgi:FAD dependent oxidoreductase